VGRVLGNSAKGTTDIVPVLRVPAETLLGSLLLLLTDTNFEMLLLSVYKSLVIVTLDNIL
jgi:hypothetical protein